MTRVTSGAAFFALALITVAYSGLVTYTVGIPLQVNRLNPSHLDNPEDYLSSLKHKYVILDVDAGVDDAMAIMLLLAPPRSNYPEVIAITCSQGNGNVTQVAINVLRTLKVLNKEIPVFIGAHKSLTVTPVGDSFFGKDAFGDVPDEHMPGLEDIQEEHAVNALVRLVAQRPNEITIFTAGPLSNIAMATRMDPTFRENIFALYWMGGSVQGFGNISPGIEFNSYMDPEANFIVFNETGCPVVVFPWEACALNNITPKKWRTDELGSIQSPFMKFLNKIEALALSNSARWTACDAKAISVLLDASIASEVSAHHINTVYQGTDARGALLVDYEDRVKPKNAVIIHSIHADTFETMCIDNLS